MARPTSKHPTELELEILKILWDEGPSPVRLVRDRLAGFRDLAYTSVMTMLGIMCKKGYVRRTKKGNSYVYRARLAQESATNDMLSDLVDRLFDGSTAAAMVHLLEVGDIDATELDKIRTLINERKGE